MSIPKIINLNENPDSIDFTFGGKAVGLAMLSKNGFKIPPTIAIEASNNWDAILEKPSFIRSIKDATVSLRESDGYSIAVRSSCTIEDRNDSSLAGHFHTIIGRMDFNTLLESMRKVAKSLTSFTDPKAAMGVVVQKAIEPDHSGVIFSSDPISFQKGIIPIEYVSGSGEDLLSGNKEGEKVFVRVAEDVYSLHKNNFESTVSDEFLLALAMQVKKLEKTAGYPLDIEWVEISNETYFVQCRPLSSITRIKPTFKHVDELALSDIPTSLTNHDKVSLRLKAQKEGIPTCDAYIYINNEASTTYAPLIDIDESENSKSFSSVIIYPKKISSKVVRSFVGNETALNRSTVGCCRYGVRSLPDYANLENCLIAFSEKVFKESWLCAIIVQEVYDFLFTGIIQKMEDSIVVEFVRGHFITKGIINPSCYHVKENKIVWKDISFQNSWYKIINGHVVFCVCDKDDDLDVSLPDDYVIEITKSFSKMLVREESIVEFGIFANENGYYKHFLLDYVDAEPSPTLSSGDLEKGIISKGRSDGEVVYITTNDGDSLDAHYYDSVIQTISEQDRGIIYFCDKPSISLLNLLNKCDAERTGFVFKEGSALCHFSVLLRERGIPALRVGSFLFYGAQGHYSLDCLSPELKVDERLKPQS